MVEPVGGDYNRRLADDDARDPLCEAWPPDFPPSLAGASRLDDWILNGTGGGSEPRYPAELFSNASGAASAAIRGGPGSPSAERVPSTAEVDNLVRGLAAARNWVSAEEFHQFVSKNASLLTELLRPFGYQGCRRTAQASLDDFDRAYSAWSARTADKVARPSVELLPKQAPVAEDTAARQQMWQTAATDPIAAAFIGAGAVISATVGRLFGFEQDPRRAAAGGQMTSIVVHSAGGAGANRTTDTEPVPLELQTPGPRGRLDGSSSRLVMGGGLDAHEAAGGHLLDKHVGLPLFALKARLAAAPRLDTVSTFVSRAEAEAAISSVMARHSASIQAWVAKGANGIRSFDGAFTGGAVLLRGASATMVGSQARVVLQGNGRGDFIILTGYSLP